LENVCLKLYVNGRIMLISDNPHLRLRENRNIKLEEGLERRGLVAETGGVVEVVAAVRLSCLCA
jgi:hypothetical protein